MSNLHLSCIMINLIFYGVQRRPYMALGHRPNSGLTIFTPS